MVYVRPCLPLILLLLLLLLLSFASLPSRALSAAVAVAVRLRQPVCPQTRRWTAAAAQRRALLGLARRGRRARAAGSPAVRGRRAAARPANEGPPG